MARVLAVVDRAHSKNAMFPTLSRNAIIKEDKFTTPNLNLPGWTRTIRGGRLAA